MLIVPDLTGDRSAPGTVTSRRGRWHRSGHRERVRAARMAVCRPGTRRGTSWDARARCGSGAAGRDARRVGTGDDQVTPDEAAAGSGLVDGAGPVRDGSGGGSASARSEVPRPVTPPQTDGNMARLEDDAIMARFVRDYLGLLDERVATITAQLESGNDLTAHISLLSLESTSSMVGAKEMASHRRAAAGGGRASAEARRTGPGDGDDQGGRQGAPAAAVRPLTGRRTPPHGQWRWASARR